jgi:hypothetical protein
LPWPDGLGLFILHKEKPPNLAAFLFALLLGWILIMILSGMLLAPFNVIVRRWLSNCYIQAVIAWGNLDDLSPSVPTHRFF